MALEETARPFRVARIDANPLARTLAPGQHVSERAVRLAEPGGPGLRRGIVKGMSCPAVVALLDSARGLEGAVRGSRDKQAVPRVVRLARPDRNSRIRFDAS